MWPHQVADRCTLAHPCTWQLEPCCHWPIFQLVTTSIFMVAAALGNYVAIKTRQHTLCVCTMGLSSSLRRSFGIWDSYPRPLKAMVPPTYCDHLKLLYKFAECLEGQYPNIESTTNIQTSDRVCASQGSSEKQSQLCWQDPSSSEDLSLFAHKPSPDWTRPTHAMEGRLLY